MKNKDKDKPGEHSKAAAETPADISEEPGGDVYEEREADKADETDGDVEETKTDGDDESGGSEDARFEEEEFEEEGFEDGDEGHDEDEDEYDEDEDEYDEDESGGGDEEDDGDTGGRQKPKGKRKGESGAPKVVFGLLLAAVIILAAVFLAVNIIKYSREIMGLGRANADTEIAVEIPSGANTTQIAKILYDEGIIGEQWLFILFSKFRGTDGSYVSGVHRLKPKMTYAGIVDELVTVIEAPRGIADVVFPEGITITEAGRRLEDKGVCNAEEFVAVFNTAEFGFDFESLVEDKSLKFYRMEGYLFPDTYRFYLDEDPRVVAKKIYANFENKITPDIYGRMDDLGLTLDQTLTFASIVQAEAPFVGDMRMVASVFWNRLNNPDDFPLLQSDPTKKYVREVLEPNAEIRSEAIFTAYDTYESAGLPPGPICNPGLDAINAVLFPADTDYFFFCADIETRETFFAKTLAEHEQNLIKAGIVLDV